MKLSIVERGQVNECGYQQNCQMLYIRKSRMLVLKGNATVCMCTGVCSFRCSLLEAFSCPGAGAVYLVSRTESAEVKYNRNEWLAGEMAQQNSSFLSVLVIKHAYKKQYRRGKDSSSFNFRSQSTTEENQDRSSSRSWEKKPWRNSSCQVIS